MTFFWLLVLALICGATVPFAWPLLRADRPTEPTGPTLGDADERATRLAVYRDRKREIELDREAGRSTAQEADAAIDELAEEVARELAPSSAGVTRRHRLLGASLLIGVPAFAVLVYLLLGAPSIIGVDPELARGRISATEMAQAIDDLTRRTREHPDDGQAWAMLARARRVQGDLPAASQAFAEAVRRLPDDGRVRADYAETLAALRNGDFHGQPEQLLQEAFQRSPNDPKVLALLGAAQYRLGHPDKALVYLRSLLQQLDPQSDQARQIRQVVDRLAGESGGAAPAASGPAAGAPQADPATRAASADSAIDGRLTLAAALKDRLAAGDTLFIAARAAQGPRMPYAAIKLDAASLDSHPRGLAWQLSDAQAMNPSRPLSQARQVVIEARISRSGNPIRQPGDLYGVSAPVKPGTRGVDIVIDQVVPASASTPQ